MQRKITDIVNLPKFLGFPSLVLAFLYGVGTVVGLWAIVLGVLRSTDKRFVVLLMDNCVLVLGLSILVIPCIYFIKELIHALGVSCLLNTTFVSEDGFHMKQERDILYEWKDIEAINGYYEIWRGNSVVISFKDGRGIEIPIPSKAREKVTCFLKEIYHEAPAETKLNQPAKKILGAN